MNRISDMNEDRLAASACTWPERSDSLGSTGHGRASPIPRPRAGRRCVLFAMRAFDTEPPATSWGVFGAMPEACDCHALAAGTRS